MPRLQCSNCINEKFYIDTSRDTAECAECKRRYTQEDRNHERVIIDIKKIRAEAEVNFNMHQDDF